MSGTIVARTRAGIPIYGTMPLDPLIHSARAVSEAVAWRKRNPAVECHCDPCQRYQKTQLHVEEKS